MGDKKHLSMKFVFSTLCIFLALSQVANAANCALDNTGATQSDGANCMIVLTACNGLTTPECSGCSLETLKASTVTCNNAGTTNKNEITCGATSSLEKFGNIGCGASPDGGASPDDASPGGGASPDDASPGGGASPDDTPSKDTPAKDTPAKDDAKTKEFHVIQKMTFKNLANKDAYTATVKETYSVAFAAAYSSKGATVGDAKKPLTETKDGKTVLAGGVTVTSTTARRSVDVTFVLKYKGAAGKPKEVDNTVMAQKIDDVSKKNKAGVTAPKAADIVVAEATDGAKDDSKAAAAAKPKANGTSSASCTGQFSLAVLSIPVIAMVISRM